MKILLLSPCKNPGLKKPRFLMIPQLSLHLISGLTPPEHEVKIVEEEVETIDIDEECDLVGISCMTANAPWAYALSEEFRKRGKKVVLGGVHPTILPEEALRHADSVVVGEAEGVWEDVCRDAAAGTLKRRYHRPFPSLDRYVPMGSRRNTKKRAFGVVPVMTTRGCPYYAEKRNGVSVFHYAAGGRGRGVRIRLPERRGAFHMEREFSQEMGVYLIRELGRRDTEVSRQGRHGDTIPGAIPEYYLADEGEL